MSKKEFVVKWVSQLLRDSEGHASKANLNKVVMIQVRLRDIAAHEAVGIYHLLAQKTKGTLTRQIFEALDDRLREVNPNSAYQFYVTYFRLKCLVKLGMPIGQTLASFREELHNKTQFSQSQVIMLAQLLELKPAFNLQQYRTLMEEIGIIMEEEFHCIDSSNLIEVWKILQKPTYSHPFALEKKINSKLFQDGYLHNHNTVYACVKSHNHKDNVLEAYALNEINPLKKRVAYQVLMSRNEQQIHADLLPGKGPQGIEELRTAVLYLGTINYMGPYCDLFCYEPQAVQRGPTLEPKQAVRQFVDYIFYFGSLSSQPIPAAQIECIVATLVSTLSQLGNQKSNSCDYFKLSCVLYYLSLYSLADISAVTSLCWQELTTCYLSKYPLQQLYDREVKFIYSIMAMMAIDHLLEVNTQAALPRDMFTPIISRIARQQISHRSEVIFLNRFEDAHQKILDFKQSLTTGTDNNFLTWELTLQDGVKKNLTIFPNIVVDYLIPAAHQPTLCDYYKDYAFYHNTSILKPRYLWRKRYLQDLLGFNYRIQSNQIVQ